jgi:hypothetical protein
MAKSLEAYPIIRPGIYDGLWSAYFVEIIFENGKKSKKIELDGGVRGVNCKCIVEVKEDGYLYVK